MYRNRWGILYLNLVWACAFNGAFAQEEEVPGLDPSELGAAVSQYAALYQQHCAVCHGEQLEGAAQGTPLVGDLKYGANQADIERGIRQGFIERGMPGWENILTDGEVRNLALYVTETRAGFSYTDFHYNLKFQVPTETINTEQHNFRLQTIVTDLDPLPYSIEPLPDGRILLTEKKLGMSIVSTDGVQSELISGTPETYDDSVMGNNDQEWGNGWMLDVALHPDYDDNGWIYLSYGDRCTDCNAISRKLERPVSMNAVIRGRIRNGEWIDEEMIWSVDVDHYGPMWDLLSGGRLTFDGQGHLFHSVGMKGPDNFQGIQDLTTPWGKIHRIYDNGDIPEDNPFIDKEGAYKSMWTYGHRTPQGLEYRKETGELWGTEMGPRGGDEVNRLLPGRNYGWPLTSKGMNYDGTPVAYGEKLGIEFDINDIEQPVVDLTPSPAVSSFIFYDGDAFPEWQNNIIVGSLKARSLYRIVLDGNEMIHQETLIADLARIRDIEIDNDGEILLLLENNAGGQVVRMVPAHGE